MLRPSGIVGLGPSWSVNTLSPRTRARAQANLNLPRNGRRSSHNPRLALCVHRHHDEPRFRHALMTYRHRAARPYVDIEVMLVRPILITSA